MNTKSKRMKVKDTVNILDNQIGIFQQLQSMNVFEWLSLEIAQSLDIEYYIGHSGEKYISLLFDKLYNYDNSNYLKTLANIININFGKNWNSVYNAYFKLDYAPIENYAMKEQETYQTNIHNTTTTNNSTYAYNSNTASPTDSINVNNTQIQSPDDNIRTLTRSGNIGVTTSQQMLQSELDLRKYQFYQRIMNDIDTILCLQIY